SDNPSWDHSYQQRKTINLPIQNADNEASNSTKPQRKTVQYIHKANTIGIPSESDITDASGNKNSNKTRLHFLGNIRNPLKSKNKSDPGVMDSGKDQDKNDICRRWSEANSNNTTYDNHIMAPGTQARLVCEWPEATLGDVVTIIRYDATQGYLVRNNAHLDEIWLPAHILSNYNRKPWSFRFRKPTRRSIDNTNTPDVIPEGPIPEFRDKLKDLTVHGGTKVVLKCRVKNCGPNNKQSWKKLEPNMCVLRNGRFLLGDNDDGVAVLNIDNAKLSDSGTYSFTLTNEYGATSCSCILTVLNNFQPINEPKIQVTSCSSVVLEWETTDYNQFNVEYCKLGTGEWILANQQPVASSRFLVENLTPGETYSFRVAAAANQVVSLPSVAVTLPVADNLRWQQEQFKRRYVELEEIDRGRFSVVRLARDRGTGVEVALKQVTRRKQPHHITQAEYAVLVGMQHVNVIRSLALFDNAPLPGIDTIVLEL
ncbi:unnamed protein product, partial [Brassicogethes aeneus]